LRSSPDDHLPNARNLSGRLRFFGRISPAGPLALGRRIVYAAEHASLAVLETLIHAGGRKMPPRAISRIYLPDDVSIESAPWMEMPASQSFGDAWVREARTAVLRVPSIAVNRMESNFVLNPGHADFPRIQLGNPEQFVFDPRFFLAG
jgi:RES domain-containing protein